MSTSQATALHDLCRHRWNSAVISVIAARNGARFVELLGALKISRESLQRTLQAAIEAGWVARSSGFGHPLRPEYILTEAGERLAPLCTSIEAARMTLGLAEASLTRWSLPTIHRISTGEHRFAAIQRALPASNPRALTSSLKSLVGQSLVRRIVVESYPPIPEYWLTERGQAMASALAA
jgi:DNA-binding HxlR family transcriptional regulator